jgi:hypothetical protein
MGRLLSLPPISGVFTSVMAAAIVALTSCSGGGETKSFKGSQKPASDANNGGQAGGGTAPVEIPKNQLDCPKLWSLAVKQQVVGAKYVYDSNIDLKYLAFPVKHQMTITASSDASITSQISIDDPILNSLVPGITNLTVALKKDKFIADCQKIGGQPIVVVGVEGDITVTEQVDDNVVINGQQIPAKRMKIQANNVKLGSYTVSADIVVYMSTLYPAVPLKQTITVTKSPDFSGILGAVISDELKSGLPPSI